ncbi:MAG TPA: hypothetical protein VII75_10020 [Thermoanaerobaculia bacterium]|nr:hypothetical protein [Thermoanaerobaculia bacterium]
MKKRTSICRLAAAAFVVLLAAACASTPTPPGAPQPAAAAPKPAPPQNLAEERSIVGTENGVRIEAHVYGDQLKEASNVTVNYSIINDRNTPVAVADLVPMSSYDPELQTVTLEIGSEVPGEQFLPRLLIIPPGGRKSFTAAAHVGVVHPSDAHFRRVPNALRVKVNFLADLKPFEKLIGISERTVHDPQLANELFPQWVERNEIVMTNTLPMHWSVTENPMGADWAAPRSITGRRH